MSTITVPVHYLPTNVPILADLYSLIKKVAGTIPTIFEATRLLVDQLNASDIERIHQKLVEHKPGEDPVIQFYEPFLKEYDPKEREARGVYYTPKPVVDYIVKSVDWLLRNKFGKVKGLADESVHLLDPATGTGTFLMSAIQEIHSNIRKENTALGDEMVKREFNKVVLSHILKHFYGFELLIAPYAIAHLKLTLEVERLGFNFALTKNDGDPDNDRFKVYLANTLDDPRPKQLQAAATSDFGAIAFPSIPQESESAREVKKNVPILAIVGNPPYSNFGRMNRGKWILNLLKDYKKDLKEKKINIDEDSIKFIRFAQWKLNETKQGIFAMITSNTFIDGITHRQMRRSLMDTYDEIYIYNLHGNSHKGETTPDGEKDENIFEIRQGVSINIFVKYSKKRSNTIVRYCDLWGLRNNKFSVLLDEDLEKSAWKTIIPEAPNWFFVVRKSIDVEEEYNKYINITQLFSNYSSGIQAGRDEVTKQYDEDKLRDVLSDFVSKDVEELNRKYNLKDSSGWKTDWAKNDIVQNKGEVIKIFYRPFDTQYTYFTGKASGFIKRPRTETMQHMIAGNNLGLILMKQVVLEGDYSHFGVSSNTIDERTFLSNRGGTYIVPLYLYPKKNLQFLSLEQGNMPVIRQPNIDLVEGRKIAECIGKSFSENLSKKGIDYLKPEDIFYYAYAIFHSNTYRVRYAEQLRIDFPRLPITTNKKLFTQLVCMGNALVNIHLLGENPLDKSKSIFDDTVKWGVKIGGVKPDKLTDWQVADIHYEEKNNRVYVNKGQYFEGVEKEVWEFMVGGYQVCDKWLKERKKAERSLSTEDLKHYMKIVVSLRETIRIMSEIDHCIDAHGGWPIK